MWHTESFIQEMTLPEASPVAQLCLKNKKPSSRVPPIHPSTMPDDLSFWMFSCLTICTTTRFLSQLSEDYTWISRTKYLVFLFPFYVLRRVSFMCWNQKLLFSVHIHTHVNKSGRGTSLTGKLPPTEIQSKLAGLGFILGKKKSLRFSLLKHKHVLFIKHMHILNALQPNYGLGFKWFTCCTEICTFKGILWKKYKLRTGRKIRKITKNK